MTREEAIKILRKEIECLSHTKCEDCILEAVCDPIKTTPYDSEYIEVYEMAIKALEQEPKFIVQSDGTIEQIKNCDDCLFKKEWEKIGKLLSAILEKQTEQEPCEDCQRIYKPNPYYDCISRQNAIDAMWEELDENTAHKVRDILELQPSVIPNQEPCEDVISRKDAINAIKRTVATEQIKELKRLPSIKPKTDVLDKIRAEIEGMTPTYHNADWSITDLVPISEVLKFIDKYTAEKE